MLERLQFYIVPALQIPLVLVFVVGWLVGGAYLLRKAARKNPERELRTISMARCVGIMLLAGVLGAMAGMMVLGIGVLLYQMVGSKALVAGFGLLGLLMMLGMGFLAVSMQIKHPAKRVWSIAWKPLVGTIVLLAVVAVAGFLPARSFVMRGAARNRAMLNLGVIKQGMQQYVKKVFFRYPDRLESLLVIGDWMNEKALRNELRPDLEVAYFYCPPDIEQAEANPTKTLLAVSYAADDVDGRAIMIWGNRSIDWLDDKDFAELLAHPTNARFAEELAKAEANLDVTSGHVTPGAPLPEETPEELEEPEAPPVSPTE
jgi:hypothetical protein